MGETKAPRMGLAAPKLSRPKIVSRVSAKELDPYDWRSAAKTVSVIIVSHDYAQFLGAAIESALNQTWPHKEVIVVGSKPIDDTRQVAARYADRGVRYLEVQENNVHVARKAGFETSCGDLICFLDADDLIPPKYLESAIPYFRDLSVGIVCSDSIRFRQDWVQDHKHLYSRPVEEIEIDNMAHVSSIVRRCCLEQTCPFQYPVPSYDAAEVYVAEDWFMWRLIAREGWKIVKQKEQHFWYRNHADQITQRKRTELDEDYFHRALLLFQPVTIFLPLSGREDCFYRQYEFLKSQDWPRGQIHIVALDSSGSGRFRRFIRRRLEELDPVRLVYDVVPSFFQGRLSNAPRIGRLDNQRKVQTAIGFIFNRMTELAGTEYILSLEDDVIPQHSDLIRRLFQSFQTDVASVAAPYLSPYQKNTYVAWTWRGDVPLHLVKDPSCPRSGVEVVGGNGFGCTILRRSILKKIRFVSDGRHHLRNADIRFYDWLRSTPWKALIDWDLECDHLVEGRK